MDKSSIGIRISNNNDDNLYAKSGACWISLAIKTSLQIQDNPPQNFYTPECYAGFLVRHEKFLRGEPMPKQIESDYSTRGRQQFGIYRFDDGCFSGTGKNSIRLYITILLRRSRLKKRFNYRSRISATPLDSSLMGIFIGDSRNVLDSRHVLYINQAFLEMFGLQ